MVSIFFMTIIVMMVYTIPSATKINITLVPGVNQVCLGLIVFYLYHEFALEQSLQVNVRMVMLGWPMKQEDWKLLKEGWRYVMVVSGVW